MSNGRARTASRVFTNWLPALAWAALLLVLGGLPLSAPTAPTGLDKVAHFSLYAVLGVLTARAWVRGGKTPPVVWIIVLAASVGALDEIHQQTVPGRYADPFDFVADTAGVLVGFLTANRLAERRKTHD
jgi:VanZ family protein